MAKDSILALIITGVWVFVMLSNTNNKTIIISTIVCNIFIGVYVVLRNIERVEEKLDKLLPNDDQSSESPE